MEVMVRCSPCTVLRFRGKLRFAVVLFEIILIFVWLEATSGKSQEHQLQWQGPEWDSENNIVSHSCIHDQIIEQRRRPGRKVYSVTPQFYKESDISKPLHRKGRALLGVSKLSELQKDAKQPIRIYLNYDAVGHSLDRDCRHVGDIVKLGEPPVSSLPGSLSCNPHGNPPILGDCWYNCTVDDISGEDKRSRLHKALGQTADWFRRALSVEPVKGNLRLSGYSACGQDGGVQLPREYVEDGVADADLVLLVTTRPTTGNTLAWAVACERDQWGRAIAGHVNVAPRHLTAEAETLLSATLIHEVMHVLGFVKTLSRVFQNFHSLPSHKITKPPKYSSIASISNSLQGSMAPVLSRSLATASLASLPSSSPFSVRNSNRVLNLRSAFVPQNGPRKGFYFAGLKWNLERKNSRIDVRCEAAVAEKEASDTSGEKYEYQAEVTRLLDLIVHSLYSHKEVFLRELVSNASDALDKLRFLSVTEPSLLGDAGELEIRIKPDPDNGTITITDTGIGMTKEELIDCLGTIAQSGTSKFLKALKENQELGADNGLIGQFGVGFYSAFLVSEKVVVSTKSPRSDKQYVWEAVADSSSYMIKEETDPEKLLRRGTQITLYLRPDDKYEFADPARIQGLVKNYSQFVSFPIYTWQEKSRTVEVEEEEEPKEGEESKPEGEKKKTTKTEKYWDWELANETKPIWMRNPKEIEKDEYHEFYKKTFNEFLDPLAHTHFTTEGEVEFRSVLYIPGMGPLNNDDVVNPKTKNIRLYVKRVFISDDFDGELFPRYLSFVKGVVDSDDLPLNVSREILQESRIVRIMRKRLVRKTFDMIQETSESENKEDYKKFWENFGRFIKLGCIEDTGNHKRIAPLLRFYTSKSEEEPKSLDDYVENMGENQKAIYYLATDSLKSAKTAPFLEKLVQKDIEVLYLIEPIDEVAIQNLQTYKEKKFVDISKEDLELGDGDEVKERETQQEYNLLCDWIKQQLGDKVAKVQVSKRLSSSPCVLVSGKFGWSANMERLMKAQALGDTSSLEFMRGRRILEVNPDHPIIKDLNAACKNAPESTDAKRAVGLLFDTALISSGFSPDSPAELGNKIYEMMAMALGGRWGRSVEEEADASEAAAESGATVEASETEVIEPSEVRAENDPWSD